MKEKYPSIFNDVIGPIMRGPSSSHCAASHRIGKLARDLMDNDIEHVRVIYDTKGSLATTHESQGGDMGLCGGLLGWRIDDERLASSAMVLKEAGIQLNIEICPTNASHPNTYRLELRNQNEVHQLTAVSTGGGMIEIIEIDGVSVSICGDYFETLIYMNGDITDIYDILKNSVDADEIDICRGGRGGFINIKARRFPPQQLCRDLSVRDDIVAIKRLFPVLPILSSYDSSVPFTTCDRMLAFNAGRNGSLSDLALQYESVRGGITSDQVFERMASIVRLLKRSIAEGLNGTAYEDRILGYQSGHYQLEMSAGKLIDCGIMNRIVLYVTALMEVKSAMGVIVAAPTAGACAGLPGACLGAAETMGLSEADITRGMLAAGMIGIFIVANATFAAEVGGCQAECGSGSGMAAAALVTMAGGTAGQAVNAASMALQNLFGMVCDPVANRVEVPCLGKNVLAASNALACANMALADFDPVIPLDEVITAMDQVGKRIPSTLRCTGLGGLSITETSKRLSRELSFKSRGS